MPLPKHSASPKPSTSKSQQPTVLAPHGRGRQGSGTLSQPAAQNPTTQESPMSELPQPGILNEVQKVQSAQHHAGEPNPPLPPLPPQFYFRPIFTVIKDKNTAKYYHPNVRYIFSDDDTDAITEAALRSLEAEHYYDAGTIEQTTQTRRKDGSGRKKAQPPASSPPERYVVVDLQPDAGPQQDAPSSTTDKLSSVDTPTVAAQQRTQGFRVAAANSMTPSWAVLDAQLSPAPTFDSSSTSSPQTQHEPSPVGGLMLKIEGTSGLGTSVTSGAGAGGTTSRQQEKQPPQRQTMEELLEQFHKRMEELRLVVEAGGLPSKEEHQDNERDNKDVKEKGREKQEETKNV
ncbi:hypothetical protein VTO42DRAFT_7669 [Malbranchea cinnamomea]